MQPWISVECNSANNVANTILQLSVWYECYESGHDEDLRLEICVYGCAKRKSLTNLCNGDLENLL